MGRLTSLIEHAAGFEIIYLPGFLSKPFWGRVVSELQRGKPVIVRYSGIFAIIGDAANFQTYKVINNLKLAPRLKQLGFFISGTRLLQVENFVNHSAVPNANPAFPPKLKQLIDSGLGFIRLPVVSKDCQKAVYPGYFASGFGFGNPTIQVISLAGLKTRAARFQKFVEASDMFPWGLVITSANINGEPVIGSYGSSIDVQIAVRDFAFSRGPEVFLANGFEGPLYILDFDWQSKGFGESYPIYVPGQNVLAREGHGRSVSDFVDIL